MLSGASLGGVVFPPLMTYLLEEYSLRGALLILGGISLNLFVAGALLQPVGHHLVQVYAENPTVTKHTMNYIKPNIMSSSLMASSELVKGMPETAGELITSSQLLIEVKEPYLDNSITKSDDSISTSNTFLQPELECAKTILVATDINNSIISIPHSAALSFGGSKILSKSSSLSSSFAQLSTLHLDPITLKELDSVPENLPEGNFSTWLGRLFKRNSKKKVNTVTLIEFSWLKNTLFIVLSTSNVLTSISWYGILIFIPSHMDTIGISQAQIAKVVSVIALADFSGRIIFPCLHDFRCCHIKYWYMIGVVVSSFVIFAATLVYTYERFLIIAGFYGLFSGCYCGLCSLIYVEMLGEENVASSYSLSLLICGLFLLGMPPAVGWFQKISGSYTTCFVVFGVVQLIGGLILLFEPYAARYETIQEFKRLNMENGSVVQSKALDNC